jgi:hypothetical protein
MKLVFSRVEAAEALGLTDEAFANILPMLFVEGFPRPIPGLGESWSIMDVMQWVNRDKPALRVVRQGPSLQQKESRH